MLRNGGKTSNTILLFNLNVGENMVHIPLDLAYSIYFLQDLHDGTLKIFAPFIT